MDLGVQKFGDWKRLVKDMDALGRPGSGFDEMISRAANQEALFWASSIKEGIRKQTTAKKANWPPLKPSTLRRRKLGQKGGKRTRQRSAMKMLIDTGSLLRAIHAEQINFSTFHIGITRQQKSKDGTSLVNIAAVHEFGTNRAGKNHNTIIPKRPFIAPVIEELNSGNELEKRMMNRVSKEIAKKIPYWKTTGSSFSEGG